MPYGKLLLDLFDGLAQILLSLHGGAPHHRSLAFLGLEDLLKVKIILDQNLLLAQLFRLFLLLSCFILFLAFLLFAGRIFLGL